MNKEKEIEEIADMLVAVCDDCNECPYGKKYGYGACTEHQMAERIYEAGYRKADEVRKETAKEIYNSLIDETVWETDTIMISVDWLKDKIKKYGVEVDE